MRANLGVAIRQVAEMHLDERLEKSREAIGKQFAAGQQKVSSAYNRLWAEMEAMREAQRKRAEEQKRLAEKEGRPVDEGKKCTWITLTTLTFPSLRTYNFIQGKHKPPTYPTLKQIYKQQVRAQEPISPHGVPGPAKNVKAGVHPNRRSHHHHPLTRCLATSNAPRSSNAEKKIGILSMEQSRLRW